MALIAFIIWDASMNANQILISSHIVNMAYAQQESQSSGASTPFLEWYEKQKDNLEGADPLSVKILSPEKDDQVPAGQELVVSGTSTDNTTADCKVSVIVNAVKPYQRTVANGTGGTDDYSTWNFVITPTYTTIKEGPDNKITSRLECTPNLTKWYSVNVTGVNTAASERAVTEMQSPPLFPALPLAGVANSSTFSADSDGRDSNPSLSISVNVASNSVAVGEVQTIEARVLDAVSHLQINNAVIELEVTDPSGNTIEESSDDDGDISYTLVMGVEDAESAIPGTFTATLRASAAGYEPESKTTTFNLVEADNGDEDVESNDIEEDEDSDSAGELFE